MAESSEQQSYSTEKLDTIIENEIQKFLNSISKSDFSIGGIGGEVTITPIKKFINKFLISKDIGDNIKTFAALNVIGKKIVKPELIDRVNAFKKEIISMRISNTIPTEERLNKLRETIGTTKTISEDSKKLQQDVENNQQNTPKTNTNPPQQKQTPPKATPKPPSSNPRPPQRQEQRQQREGVQEGREYISKEHVERVWQDILNGATYQSDTKGKCTRGINEYKGVCTTGAYNVLSRLINLPPPGNTDYNGYEEKLKAMHCYFYRDDVNPKNPYAGGYKPKDGDMAVRPRFESKHGRTQHMACYIHGERVSDTIQRRMGPNRKPTNIPTMSCYLSDPKEPQKVQIYRYDPKRTS